MQYGHIYAAICIMIKLKVMFWKLYTRIYFNVGTFNININFFSLMQKITLNNVQNRRVLVTYSLQSLFE